jgi:hypothetical protein
MEAKVQRILIWTGPVMMIVWVGAFLLVAGFIPPSDPGATAEQIVHMYAERSGAIKIGLVFSMLGSALLVPFGVAISGQIKRIDGGRALADVQMVSCALLSLEFITPIGVWMAASFRFDAHSPEVTQAIHDLGWILFMTVIWSAWVQLLAIGVAILIDRREQPILPRWLGYMSFWVSLLIIPTGIVLFFKSGPFAWNGIIGFYGPLVAFSIWIISMTTVVHKALTRQIAEGSEPGVIPAADKVPAAAA